MCDSCSWIPVRLIFLTCGFAIGVALHGFVSYVSRVDLRFESLDIGLHYMSVPDTSPLLRVRCLCRSRDVREKTPVPTSDYNTVVRSPEQLFSQVRRQRADPLHAIFGGLEEHFPVCMISIRASGSDQLLGRIHTDRIFDSSSWFGPIARSGLY